ncbi:MAG: hypothetical protein ACRBC3_20065 [Burkholderiaceae bacterium]
MLLELIATLALGSAVAGVVLMISRFSGNKLPRSFAPVAAGLGMIVFQVWSEYAWFERTSASLPTGIQVTASYQESAPWRPWSYFVPQTTRFAAVDVATARRNQNQPGQVMADVLLFARFTPTSSVPQLIDCSFDRRANLADGATFGVGGAVRDADWVALDRDDPLLAALCR